MRFTTRATPDLVASPDTYIEGMTQTLIMGVGGLVVLALKFGELFYRYVARRFQVEDPEPTN